MRNVSLRTSALIAAVVLLLAACSDSDGGDVEQAASVNGEAIPTEEVQSRYDAMTQGSQLSSQLYGNPAMQDQLRAQIVTQLIQVELLRQGADELGVEVGDAELDEQRYQLEQQVGGEYALQQAIEQQGLSEEDVRQELQALALQQAIAAELTSGYEVTDQDVQTYFEENTAQFRTAQVRIIAASSQSDAEQAVQRLQDGDDFAAVAEELGTGQGSSQAQEVTAAQLQQSSPDLADAIFEQAEVGGIAGPVQAQGVSYVVEVQQRTEPELADVEGQIREQLRNQRRSTQLQQWLTEQSQSAEIEVADRYGTWDAYARQVRPDTGQSQGSGGSGSGGSGSGGSGSGGSGSGGSGE